MKRLEYRGYDSAGVAVDGGNEASDPEFATGDMNNSGLSAKNSGEREISIFREQGKVNKLETLVFNNNEELDMDLMFETHVGIAHTCWF